MYCTSDIIRMLKYKEDEMGRACGMYGGEEKCMQSVGGETRKKQTAWKIWI